MAYRCIQAKMAAVSNCGNQNFSLKYHKNQTISETKVEEIAVLVINIQV